MARPDENYRNNIVIEKAIGGIALGVAFVEYSGEYRARNGNMYIELLAHIIVARALNSAWRPVFGPAAWLASCFAG